MTIMVYTIFHTMIYERYHGIYHGIYLGIYHGISDGIYLALYHGIYTGIYHLSVNGIYHYICYLVYHGINHGIYHDLTDTYHLTLQWLHWTECSHLLHHMLCSLQDSGCQTLFLWCKVSPHQPAVSGWTASQSCEQLEMLHHNGLGELHQVHWHCLLCWVPSWESPGNKCKVKTAINTKSGLLSECKRQYNKP
jgi:hypothetical protein